MVTWYSVTTYQNTYSYLIKLIRLKDFKDIRLYVTDNKYDSDDPFVEQIKLKAKALKLAQLRSWPKKRRIRKATKERPKKQLRYDHCKELGYNRKGYKNRQREPEVTVISSDKAGSDKASNNKASNNKVSSDEVSNSEASSDEASSDEVSNNKANSDEANNVEDKDELV